MERCKTCKFWKWVDEDEAGWGFCHLADAEHRKPLHRADTKAKSVGADSSLESYLMTRPDFGCVQHEPAEPEPGPAHPIL